jgi:hypothetical protein
MVCQWYIRPLSAKPVGGHFFPQPLDTELCLQNPGVWGRAPGINPFSTHEFCRRAQKQKALIEADNGKIQVQGCSFATGEPSILLGRGLKHAIVNGNNGEKGVTITNQIGKNAIISNNEPGEQ